MDRPTIEIYETQAAEYEARRRPVQIARARSLRAAAEPPIVDLGCGPGWYAAALGEPAVALDAARAMLRRTREVAPDALLVQADLSALPFRAQSLGGGWARNSYVHLRAVDVPLALADLHRALRVDAAVDLSLFGGHDEGRHLFDGDDFPGRYFSTWAPERLTDVVTGAGFGSTELVEHRRSSSEVSMAVLARRARTLPDTVGADMRLLVCGLNPSLHAADAGVGFVTPNNRFWTAAMAADLVSRDRDPRHALVTHGVGMTDLVKRATPRASELSRDEYRDGLARVTRLCEWLQPGAVCFVGLAGWRAAADRTATAGWQPTRLGGAPVYVMPSTSGLNAAVPISALTDHLRAAQAGPEARVGAGGL